MLLDGFARRLPRQTVAAATCAAAWMATACSDVLTLTFLYDEGTETPGAVMTCTLPAAS